MHFPGYFIPSPDGQEVAQGTAPAPHTSAMMGYTCSMHREMMLGRKGLNTWPGSCTTTCRIFRNFSTTRQPVLPSWRILSANCSLQTKETTWQPRQRFAGTRMKTNTMVSEEEEQKNPTLCSQVPLLLT